MTRDYIPRNDKEFEQFFRNITDYVLDNNARWKHIPKDDVDILEDQFSRWNTAYEKTLVPHIPQLTAEKNRVRLSTERALRHFVNRFLRFEPVTDLDRDKMRIPNRDLIRTPHIAVRGLRCPPDDCYGFLLKTFNTFNNLHRTSSLERITP